MQSQLKQRLNSLTSMRFVAALFVAVHHTRAAWAHTPMINAIGQFGWLGVSYFFILSGFVLMWGFDPTLPKSSFIWKRLVRIYPLHFVCLIASLVAFALFGRSPGGYTGTIPGTVANFLLVHDWLPHHPEIRQAWNGVSWTLSCELFFYLLAPWLFARMSQTTSLERLFSLVVVAYLCLLSLALYGVHAHKSGILDILIYHPLPRLFEFVLGASGAMFMRRGRCFYSVPLSLALMVVPVALYCASTSESIEYEAAVMIQLFIPGALLFIMSLASRDIAGIVSVFTRKRLVFLGDTSYALYMTHALFLGVFTTIRAYVFPISTTSPFWGEVITVIYLCLAVGISVLTHLYFELPAKNWLLKFSASRSSKLQRSEVRHHLNI